MAIYEFLCRKCNKIFEVKVPIGEELILINCPKCQEYLEKNDFKKLVSKSSFVLKFDTNY